MLALIVRSPNMTLSELALKMDITKSTVSQQLLKLESAMDVYRKQHTEDRRAFVIKLSEKGEQYKQELGEYSERITEKYKKHLSNEEMKMMFSSLKKLHKILKED